MPASKSQITTASSVLWSTGALFDGYVVFFMSIVGDQTATKISLIDSYPAVRVPTVAKVPIRLGVIDPNTRIWKTTSLVPPGMTYFLKYYDNNNTLIATAATPFALTADPHTITPPTLTPPVP